MVSYLILKRLVFGSPEGVLLIVLANFDNNVMGSITLDNKEVEAFLR